MARDIRITPNKGTTASGLNPEIKFTGTSSAYPIKLIVNDNGSIAYTGTYGTLVSIVDDRTSKIYSVADISGIPIFSVYSNDYVQMGKYTSNTLIVNSDRVGVGLTAPSTKFHIKGASGSFRLQDGSQVNGYYLICDVNGVASWKPLGASSSYVYVLGTNNYVSRFGSGGTLVNSNIYDNGISVGMGVTTSTDSRVRIMGLSNSESTYGLRVLNGSASSVFKVRDDGVISSHVNRNNNIVYYGGTLYDWVTDKSSVGTATNSLYRTSGSVSLAGIFKKPGDIMKSVFSGYINASNGTTQSLDLAFDGIQLIKADPFQVGGALTYWRMESSIMSTDYVNKFSSETRFSYSLAGVASSRTTLNVMSFTTSGYLNNLPLVLRSKTTGATGDIVGTIGYLEFEPSANVISTDFTIIIDTTKSGYSASDQFILPLNDDYSYNAVINWGDGTTTTQISNVSPIHTYPSPGTYTISISGIFPAISFYENLIVYYGSDAPKVLSIESWGSGTWLSFAGAFFGCNNMVGNYSDVPNTSSVTDMSGMFVECFKFNSTVNFNTSNVTNMGNMFTNATLFNQSVGSFNTSLVTDMGGMFGGATNFNQSVSNFDTSNVISMGSMFSFSKFNQSVSNFNTSNVVNMAGMFSTCPFNQSLSTFDTSNVTDMGSMFYNNVAFNQSLSFVTTSLINMGYMFFGASSFNQSLSTFNTLNVIVMESLFAGSAFNQSLASFNTSNVVNMNGMFRGNVAFNQSLATFDTSKVTNMSYMFYGCNYNNSSVSSFNTISVTNMDNMFSVNSSFNQNISSWNVTNLQSASQFISNTGYSYLGDIYNNWSSLGVKSNVTLSTSCKYSIAVGGPGRSYLVSSKNWTITDTGGI